LVWHKFFKIQKAHAELWYHGKCYCFDKNQSWPTTRPCSRKLEKINGVNKAYNTMNGTYDFVAEVKTKTIEELRTIVLPRIRKTNAVDSATTLMVAQK
jgi:hypothetical protein